MKFTTNQIITGITHPFLILLYFIRKLPLSLFFLTRLHIDGIDRPYYGYGLYQAAYLAKKLRIPAISAIEFGVASGRGLLLLEKLAKEITKHTGVTINIYGFDLAVGLPSPSDYRDLPYIWKKGFYKMDVPKLQKQLSNKTELILGDVKKTVPRFVKNDIAPIGFIAFDLDYYSATTSALTIFKSSIKKLLPRVFCYFDDIIGPDEMIMCPDVGELLAIKEFNNDNSKRKIYKIHGLFHKRIIKATWTDMLYVLHNFSHPLYNQFIYHED